MKLLITVANGDTHYGTGFIVRSGRILTSAHNLKNSLANPDNPGAWIEEVKVFYNYQGGSYSDSFSTGIDIRVPSAWSSANNETARVASEFGVITVPTNDTSGKTMFNLNPNVSYGSAYTMSGYPRKLPTYTSEYMYTDVGIAELPYIGGIKHTINCVTGLSGAPMYDYNNNVVGIQSVAYSNPVDFPVGEPNDPKALGGFATPVTNSVIYIVENF